MVRATWRRSCAPWCLTHPNLVVGLAPGDDAAVYLINESQAIVQTVDFFPPIVDDPPTFGAIAAANSMSDVYAMGAEVALALNIVAFPTDLDKAILTAILQGRRQGTRGQRGDRRRAHGRPRAQVRPVRDRAGRPAADHVQGGARRRPACSPSPWARA